MKKARVAAALSMVMALSAVCGMSASAADKAFQLDVANWTDRDWNSIAMANDDTVVSGVVIRSAADKNSDAVGYLYRGAAVEILNRDDKWTEIQSGTVTGYVMNDYLVSGDAAKGLADHYGKEGVVANWNDVNVYENQEAGAVLKTAQSGTAFPLVSDQGHWLLVQQGADQAGYISEEDASRMLLVDTAVPVNGEEEVSSYVANLGGSQPAASAGSSSADGADQGEAAVSDGSADYGESAGAGEDAGSDETASADQQASTDQSYQETSETYASQTVSSDANVQALYDAYIAAQNAAMTCTSEDDAKAKAQAAVDAYNAYVAAANGSASASTSAGQAQETSGGSDASSSAQTGQAQTPQTEAAPAQTPQTEAAPVQTPQTEAPQTEAAEPAAQASSSTGSYADFSDLDLLAAIIWCEAGNQPYDGMVAVGEVVMNRVASPSFPNTIADVLEQPGQFSPYASGRLQSALAAGVNSNCYAAAQDALNGASPVPGALYFNTHSGTTKLGDHYFS